MWGKPFISCTALYSLSPNPPSPIKSAVAQRPLLKAHSSLLLSHILFYPTAGSPSCAVFIYQHSSGLTIKGINAEELSISNSYTRAEASWIRGRPHPPADPIQSKVSLFFAYEGRLSLNEAQEYMHVHDGKRSQQLGRGEESSSSVKSISPALQSRLFIFHDKFLRWHSRLTSQHIETY